MVRIGQPGGPERDPGLVCGYGFQLSYAGGGLQEPQHGMA